MPKIWRLHPHDAGRAADLERAAGIPNVIARLLLLRGIESHEVARRFLDPKLTELHDPETLPGVTAAVDELTAAIAAKQRIVVYGDYDADGMTATAILFSCLKLLGADVGYYVPSRLDEGYGLNDDALRSLAARKTQVVITVDCGVSAVAQGALAAELGLRLIITDHHEMGPTLPAAVAIVHPRLPGTDYPFKDLCGAGVAFKVAWALCQRISRAKRVTDAQREFLLQAVGLAAIGTIADVVPLRDENRVIVRFGLEALKQRPPAGIAALMKLVKLSDKPKLESDDIGFALGPRLNAAGRLGQAQLGVELLTTNQPERAAALAEYLHELNSQRDSLERSVYLAAHKQIQEEFDVHEDAAFVLAGKGWHPGIIGIVAGRLAEKHHRPVVLIAHDELGVKPGTGSVRSVPGFDVYAALNACGARLLGHGGHMAAAGLKIDAGETDAFRRDFCDFVRANISAEQRRAEVWIDAETTLASLTRNVIDQIDRIAPFGHGNPRPILSADNVELVEPPKKIGNDRHLSFKLRQYGCVMRGVAFGGGEWHDAIVKHNGPLKIAFRPVLNHFNGRVSVEAQITDWHPMEAVRAKRPDAVAGQAPF